MYSSLSQLACKETMIRNKINRSLLSLNTQQMLYVTFEVITDFEYHPLCER